jgi:hypothetical protein
MNEEPGLVAGRRVSDESDSRDPIRSGRDPAGGFDDSLSS